MAKIFKMSALVFLITAILIPVAGLAAFHIVPIKTLKESLESSLSEGFGITAQMRGFERVFPFGLRAKDIAVKDASSGRPLLNIDGAWVGLNPLSIFSGGIGADFKASLNGGIVTGSVVLRPSGRSIEMKMQSVSLLSIPAFQRLKITAGVPFDGDLLLELPEKGCPTGGLRLTGKAGSGAEVRLGGMPLPIGRIDSAGIEMIATRPPARGECHLDMKSLWLKGSELEAQVSGSSSVKDPVEASLVDIVIEVMPKGRLLKQEYILSLIKAYRSEDGIYRIPVKGRLGEVMPE
ncbi:MAG: type II secretion system protein GspN [Deltaproteobacteria bacterium]